jgi:hypothetical protein
MLEIPNGVLAQHESWLGDFFLQHVWERAQFYDSLAQIVLARRLIR